MYKCVYVCLCLCACIDVCKCVCVHASFISISLLKEMTNSAYNHSKWSWKMKVCMQYS